MRIVSLTLFLASTLLAQWYEVPHTIANYPKAKKICQEHGKGWRLPDIKELFTLKGQTDRFSSNESFWAANLVRDGISIHTTGSEGDAGLASGRLRGYSFFLQDGDIAITPLNKEIGIICTNAKSKKKSTHYSNNTKGVFDTENEIIWMPLEATNKKKRYSYEAALEHCEELDFADRSWRLPTLDELYSIVDYTHSRPTLNTKTFGMMMHRYYWSEDEYKDDHAYVVGFKFGSVATSAKINRSYVRCVSDID